MKITSPKRRWSVPRVASLKFVAFCAIALAEAFPLTGKEIISAAASTFQNNFPNSG